MDKPHSSLSLNSMSFQVIFSFGVAFSFAAALLLLRDPSFDGLYESKSVGDVVEDQNCLVLVQNRVVVGEALVVAHITEGVENRDRRLQDSLRHLGFNQAVPLQEFRIELEQALKRSLLVKDDAMPAAQFAHILIMPPLRTAEPSSTRSRCE